jgi:hypothetical protein
MERARLETLIQAQLDNELSAGERAELASLVLRDAEARRLHDEFQRTDRLLRDIPVAEPPPGLREAILARSARPERPDVIPDPGRWASAHRIAATVVGGLLIVGLAYLVSDGRAPGEALQGSLQAGRGPELPGPAAGEARASLQASGIAVEAVLHRDGEALRLELGSAAAVPVEVAIRIDPRSTSFAGSAEGVSLASSGDEILVRLPAGRQRTTLDLSGAAPLLLELRAGGRVLNTATFALSAPRGA